MSTKRLGGEQGKSESKRQKGHKSHKKDRKESKRQSGESGEQWVEASSNSGPLKPMLKRDDWMTIASQPSESRPIVKPVTPTSRKKKESIFDKPGQHPRELNPYWKDGGAGLPKDSDEVQGNVEGRSWIFRSYKRALEQAEKRKVPFKEIAEKQWGSIEKIHSLLRSVGVNPTRPDGSSSSASKSFLYSQPHSSYDRTKERYPKPSGFDTNVHFSDDSRSSKNTFLRPGDDSVHIDVGSYNNQNWQVDQELLLKQQPAVVEAEAPKENSSAAHEDRVTEVMINSTSAKLIKAELVGNQKKVEQLKRELDDLRSKKKTQDSQLGSMSSQSQDNPKDKTVLLTKTDRFGRTRPAEMPSSNFKHSRSSKGKSKKYFSEDYSMKSMLEQEHYTTAEDTYEAIAKMASKFVRSNPDDIVDDVLDVNMKSNPQKDDEKLKLKALTESRRMEEMMDSCKLCVNSNFKKHLLVAMGINTYLCVPSCQSLTTHHCLIVPLEHTVCSLQMDENVWSEVKIFQKGLTKMFSDFDMDVVFTECYTSTARRSHMYIDCIPVPKDEGSMAPMYFKKAILESDTEWVQNKRLVDTRQKELRNSIPVGLPYFFVDFNNEGGFAHVIEDSSLFPHYFAKEVIGGLIDAEPRLWLKPQHEGLEQQKIKTFKLIEKWKPYDWTKKLKP